MRKLIPEFLPSANKLNIKMTWAIKSDLKKISRHLIYGYRHLDYIKCNSRFVN